MSFDLQRLKSIKAIVMDVDGVLTDGSFWWGPDGEEWKRFGFADVMGVSLARKAGLILCLVSGENSTLVDRYAKKMSLADVFKGCKDKGEALNNIQQQHKLSRNEISFIGDDVNDLPAFDVVGVSVAPANAHAQVLARADIILNRHGGHGAVREFIDMVLEHR